MLIKLNQHLQSKIKLEHIKKHAQVEHVFLLLVDSYRLFKRKNKSLFTSD